MSSQLQELEPPTRRRRLLRTVFRKHRNVLPFARPIALAELSSRQASKEELLRWGQVDLLDDLITVLHRDGTPTYRRRWMLICQGVKQIEQWEHFEFRFDKRNCRISILCAYLQLASGKRRYAKITDRPCGRWGYSRLLEVTFPHMVPGAVMEVEYQQDNFTPYEGCPGVWGAYALQTQNPCRRRRHTLAVASPFTARIQLHHEAPAPDERLVRKYKVFTWDLYDVAGIELDEATPPLCEFAPWADFSTLPSWTPLARLHASELKLPLPLLGATPRTASSTASESSESEIAQVYRQVSREVRYGRPKESLHVRAARSPGRVTEQLRGDCKDQAVLLATLLRERGIQAYIAVVRTSRLGRVQTLPGVHFDHAVVVVVLDGKEFWLDPTAKGYAFGQIPSNDQGVQALVLDKHQPRLVLTPRACPADHRIERTIRGRLEADGSFQGTIRLLARGDRAAVWRHGLFARGEGASQHRLLCQYVGGSLPSAAITDVAVGHLDDLLEDLTIAFNVCIGKFGRRIRNLMLLRAPWTEPLRNNGFFAEINRPQPLQVPVYSVSDCIQIDLSVGFSGYSVPAEHVERCDWGCYQCRAWTQDGTLQCTREFELLGGVVLPDRCPDVAKFTHACIDADASDIVLIGNARERDDVSA